MGCIALLVASLSAQAAPFFADGAKTGEVTSTSVVLWTRLTQNSDANWEGALFPRLDLAELRNAPTLSQIPDGASLADMQGALPGCAGKARVTYWHADHPEDTIATAWQAADADADFILNFLLNKLRPGTRYEFMIEAKSPDSKHPTATFDGAFTTAPVDDADASIRFVTAAGFDWNSRDDAGDQGHLIYESMANLNPNFFVHAGDIVNYEAPGPIALNLALARHKWNRMWVLKNSRDFYRRVPCYMMSNQQDAWIPQLTADPSATSTKSQVNLGQRVFREQVPALARPYRTFRWGQHLQIWLMASTVTPVALAYDPSTPIWGEKQLDWVEKSLATSDASFKIFLTPSLLVKHWQNPPAKPTAEITRIRTMFTGKHNLFVVSANRQWQSNLTDPQTGLRIYGIGPGSEPATSEQDSATSQETSAGFLEVTIDPEQAPLEIAFTFYDVDGNEIGTKSYAKE